MRTFIAMTREEFDHVLTAFRWRRKITAVHMHHTWSPNHAQWRGVTSMEGMYRYHTQTNGWSDIAQHVTIAPDGLIWSGRDWNRSPASSNGYNGGSAAGPFMFETVGNFDKGHDKLEGEQLKSVLHVISQMQLDRGLETESLRFHRQLGSPKTCPGTSIDYDWMLDRVDDYKRDLLVPKPVILSNTPGIFTRLKKHLWG